MLPEECIKASFQWISKKKTGKNNPEKIWWFQNNDVLLHPKSSIKSCPVAAHQPSFA